MKKSSMKFTMILITSLMIIFSSNSVQASEPAYQIGVDDFVIEGRVGEAITPVTITTYLLENDGYDPFDDSILGTDATTTLHEMFPNFPQELQGTVVAYDNVLMSISVAVTGTLIQAFDEPLQFHSMLQSNEHCKIKITDYVITTNVIGNGTLTVTETAKADTQITLNATAQSGYYLASYVVMTNNGLELDVQNNQFTMPNSDVIVTVTFKQIPVITEHADTTRTAGSHDNLIIKCSGEYRDIMGIYIDDQLLSSDHYTLATASTILTLKASYLNTLPVGKHKVTFQYPNVTAVTSFTILEEETVSPEPIPTPEPMPDSKPTPEPTQDSKPTPEPMPVQNRLRI